MPVGRAEPDDITPERRDAADRLDAIWDDLIHTGVADLSAATAAADADADAARASLVAYIDVLTPKPDSTARQRLHRRIAADIKEPPMTTPSIPYPTLSANGHHPRSPGPYSPGAPANDHRWWHRPLSAFQVATTVALIIATVGGILLIRPGGDRPSLPTASSPLLAIGTPEMRDTDRGEASTSWEIPAGGPIGTQLVRMTLGPDSTWAYQNDGLIVFWVLEGRISVEGAVDGPQVHGPRGAAFFSGTGRTEVRAGGNAPAVVLVGLAYAEATGTGMTPENGEGRLESVLLARGSTTLPPGPALVSISQDVIPLSDETSFSIYPGNEVLLFGITSGALRITRLAGQIEIVRDIAGAASETGGWAEHRLGEAIMVMPGDGVTAQPRAGYAVESVGPGDATLVGFAISSKTRVDATVPGPRGDELMTADSADCQAEPRDIQSLYDILDHAGTNATPDAGRGEALQSAILGGSSADETPEARLGNAAPSATPADAQATEAVTATVRESLACVRFGTPLQSYASFSDDAIQAAFAANGYTIADIDRMAGQSASPDAENGSDPIFAIDDIVSFPDGRAGAIVNADGEIAYLTFVRDPDTGRWLIDAWDDRDAVTTATPEP